MGKIAQDAYKIALNPRGQCKCTNTFCSIWNPLKISSQDAEKHKLNEMLTTSSQSFPSFLGMASPYGMSQKVRSSPLF